MDDLGANGDSGVHQFTVVVIEIILEFNAIGVDEFDGFIAFLVAVGIDDEPEIARLHLGFVEHPFVEEQILVAGGRHHEGDGAALWARDGFAGLVDGLVELVSTFHHTVCFFTYGKVALKCHDVVIDLEFFGGGILPQMNAPDEGLVVVDSPTIVVTGIANGDFLG